MTERTADDAGIMDVGRFTHPSAFNVSRFPEDMTGTDTEI
jgi:hypothetical protein